MIELSDCLYMLKCRDFLKDLWFSIKCIATDIFLSGLLQLVHLLYYRARCGCRLLLTKTKTGDGRLSGPFRLLVDVSGTVFLPGLRNPKPFLLS